MTFTPAQTAQLEWIKERYNGLLEKTWGKAHLRNYPGLIKQMKVLDRERYRIYKEQCGR